MEENQKNFYTVDYQIGCTVENNLTNAIQVSKLPYNLKQKKTICYINPEKSKIQVFKRNEDYSYNLYAFELHLYDTAVQKYYEYVSLHDSYLKNAFYYQSLAQDCYRQFLDKTRTISVPVTKYRTVYRNGYSYQEPYTSYEYYTEHYQVANRNFNPTLGDQYTKQAQDYIDYAVDIKKKMTTINTFDLYFAKDAAVDAK